MQILFLTYHGFEEASGISKKMLAQIKGLRQNGHQVSVCYYDISPEGARCRYVDGKVIRNYGSGRWATLLQRMDYNCIVDYCRAHQIELVYVRCFMNASPFNIRLFRRLQASGIRTVMEIPTYPYDKEFASLPFKYRFEHIFDKLFRRRLAAYMDAIVTFSEESEIFGRPTIRISNGVDFDSIPLHQPMAGDQSSLHLIGVAEVHPWHGFDRVMTGMGEYYQQAAADGTDRKVFFHVVGGVSDAMMHDFRDILHHYGIEQYVVFHGKLFGDELTAVFNQCRFAIGSLGRHRSGITVIKTLKNREYAARGLPFIYSEQDADFDGQPYVLKASADETPVNIRQLLDFYDHFRLSPREIRQTVSQLDWKTQMQQVVEHVNYKLKS